MHSALRHIYTVVLYCLAAVALTAAVALSAFRVFMPMVPGYRAQLEQWVSQAAKRPVHIGSISAGWQGLGPELDLRNVAVSDVGTRKQPVRFKHVRVGFSVWRMLRTLSLTPSRIAVAGARLDVTHTAAGHWRVEGFATGGHGGSLLQSWRAAVPVLQSYGSLRVVDSSVTLHLEGQTHKLEKLTGVHAEISSTGKHQHFSGGARLPGDIGDRIHVEVDADGNVREPSQWDVQASISGTGLRPGHYVARMVPDTLDLAHLVLDVDAHGEWRRGKLRQVRADVSANRIVLPPTGSYGVARVRKLAGRFLWTRLPDGWRLQGRHVILETGQGRWPSTGFTLSRTDSGGSGAAWEAHAGFARLQDVARIGVAVPQLGSRLRHYVMALHPRGDLSDASFRFARGGKALSGLQLQAQLKGLGWQPYRRLPGMSGLAGALDVRGNQGSLHIRSTKAAYRQPALFPEPLRFNSADAKVAWHLGDHGAWHVHLARLDLANPDTAVDATGTMTVPPGQRPDVDLKARIRRGDATAVARYLPRGHVPEKTIRWLDKAIKQGHVTGGTVTLKGPLKRFPFGAGGGEFRVAADVQGGAIDYAHQWPPATAIDGKVVFAGNRMHMDVSHATVSGLQIDNATVNIPDIRHAHLQIQAHATGDNGSVVSLLQHTPLEKSNPELIDGLSGSGPADIHLGLKLPIRHPQQVAIDGTLAWQGASLGISGTPLRLTDVNGKLSFTRTRFAAKDITARFQGRPLHLHVTPAAGKRARTVVTASGSIDAQGIEGLSPAIPRGLVHGATDWKIRVGIPPAGAPAGERPVTTLRSDLRGLAIELPEPLGKKGDTRRPLAVRVASGHKSARQVSLDYGGTLTAALRFDHGAQGWRFERGGMHFGAGRATLPPVPGLRLSGHIDRLSIPALRKLRQGLGGGGGPPRPPAWLSTVELSVGNVAGAGMPLENIMFRYRRRAKTWRVGLVSGPLAGSVTIPRDGGGPWVADLQHIRIPTGGGAGASQWLKQLSPQAVPAMNVRCREVRIGSQSYGSMEARVRPSGSGVSVSSLTLKKPHLKISASGTWTEHGAQQVTHVDARVQSGDPQAALKNLGFAPPLTAKSAKLQTNLDWPGSPMDFSMQRIAGTLTLDVRNGSLLKVNPGPGRVFGLFSLYALPRRLSLDFGDVFGKGLGFDRINGDFVVRGGNAYTSDLVLDGPAVKVAMDGRIGLASHDFDQKIVVTPSLSSSVAIAGGIAGGPLVGAAIFLVQQLLHRPIGKASQIVYHLTGPWDKPQIKKAGSGNLQVPDHPGDYTGGGSRGTPQKAGH
ncbi:MAG TPA: YhdP family protein [Gammaproteobacteria bacterium]|nr:YhdP family protein [Gammaproteobacteria bacterium]